jgi:hypothetical protein
LRSPFLERRLVFHDLLKIIAVHTLLPDRRVDVESSLVTLDDLVIVKVLEIKNSGFHDVTPSLP